jgi:redox-sensitive bicupin YhaK (pirin superfamily)
MEAGAKWTMPKTEMGVNRTAYFYQGESLIIADKNIPTYHAVGLVSDMEIQLENGPTETRILVLQGRPIGEPVMQYGPFVMNTKDEINQAFNDYNNTQFGGWPWPKYDQVHPREKGRFAKHADGREEVK